MPSAEDLFERMQRSKVGWRFKDLDTLYRGFGFECREGAKHALYIHPNFPELITTVGRHRSLPIGYINDAIKLIKRLKEKEAESNG
ncbi:MAG: hypothetical protein Q8P59_11680 [Dehalococcoidia bacterium]|nr:hypothetical protein [Dehalococcoidia bacterium]